MQNLKYKLKFINYKFKNKNWKLKNIIHELENISLQMLILTINSQKTTKNDAILLNNELTKSLGSNAGS